MCVRAARSSRTFIAKQLVSYVDLIIRLYRIVISIFIRSIEDAPCIYRDTCMVYINNLPAARRTRSRALMNFHAHILAAAHLRPTDVYSDYIRTIIHMNFRDARVRNRCALHMCTSDRIHHTSDIRQMHTSRQPVRHPCRSRRATLVELNEFIYVRHIRRCAYVCCVRYTCEPACVPVEAERASMTDMCSEW